ncbi:MAG: thioredoxin family protein [Pirellulaceae bacterium]|nr:thioredoxin family protein [Pirellulaceae bacterium]
MDIKRCCHICLLTLLSLGGSAQGQDRIQWTGDLDQALKTAASYQQLVLLHFWSDNCPPCVTLERRVFNRPEVIRSIHNAYVPVKINVNQTRELATHFRITQWPTDIILTPDGKEIFRGVSSQDPSRFIMLLDQQAAHFRTGQQPQVAINTALPDPRFTRSQNTQPPLGLGYSPNPYTTNAPTQPNSTRSQSFADNRTITRTNTPADPLAESPSQPSRFQPAFTNQVTARAPSNNQKASRAPLNDNPANEYLANPYTTPASRTSAQPGSQLTPAANEPRVDTKRHFTPSEQNFEQNIDARQPIHNEYVASANKGSAIQEVATEGQGDAPTASASDEFALNGFCPVTLVLEQRWQLGVRKWGAVHRGEIYLFANQAAQQRFLSTPEAYAPALSGYDVVHFAETGVLLKGKREHGITFHNEIFLFVDEQTLQAFWNSPEKMNYVHHAKQVMAEHDRLNPRHPARSGQ